MYPGRGIQSAVGKNETKYYREAGGRESLGSGMVGFEEI